MSTPQDPARRKKQKRRREKQLATWRANRASQGEKPEASVVKPAEKLKKKAPAATKRAS